MPNAIYTPHPSDSEQKTLLEDVRADWERPAMRRLAAIEAQDEGGNPRHHFSRNHQD